MLGQDQPVIRARRLRRGVVVVLAALALAGCAGGEPSADPAPSTESAVPTNGPTDGPTTSGESPTPTASPSEPPALPQRGECFRLSFKEAVAPTVDQRPVRCTKRGVTARTLYVGQLKTSYEGHLVAVDSAHVQEWVAGECPRRLQGLLGGDQSDQRLSMLRAIWFTPSVGDSDAGASWLRCDLVVLARDGRLAPLPASPRGLLDRPEAADFALCATAAPDDPGFARVICSAKHTWRALSVVRLGEPAGEGERAAYPGVDRVKKAGTGCEEVSRASAVDALDFRWGYEWPTPEQWSGGRTYGVCWAPADGS